MGERKQRHATAGALLLEARELHEAGRLEEAKACYRRALQAEPSLTDAWVGLGTLAHHVGAHDAAIQAFAHAVALAPGTADLLVRYAEVLQEGEQYAPAATQLRTACGLRPDDAALWERLGIAQQSLGDTDAARESYRRAAELAPNSGVRLKLATLSSPVIASREAMFAERARQEAELDALLMGPSSPLDDPLRDASWPNFYLAFQGCNDRALQTRFAAMYRKIYPSLDYVALHCRHPLRSGGRIRVGLLSKFFCNHSIGRTSRGLFAGLARDEFDVTAIFVAPVVADDYSRFIREHAEHHIVVPQDLPEARRAIAALELDVLFYQDIGMEPFAYFLAFSRLAPVQCVSFGHPDTTGVPTMDYFVSNDLYETAEAQEHYSERLFLLHDLGSLAYYYRPVLHDPPKPRSAFGLGDDDHLYLCPQNVFKFHPDMDTLIAGILRRDPRGRLVVIAARIDDWTRRLRLRWAAAMPDVVDRIVFLPRQRSADYLNLIAVSDVMLDTVHFNGMNTSLEALSVGTPVVTLPGEFQRGRHTLAMYRKMGMPACVATDAAHYIDLAVGLGTDREHRQAVHEEILRRNGVLFEDVRVVREFERFFREAVARAERVIPIS